MAGDRTSIPLDGIVLPNAVSGGSIDLGAEPPRALLTIIRHRY
ncbi:MAG TPA: hypothetical protein VM942_00695 [Acidimicrobiales bacterium]|nr:hypothetical protein [Acidimicrobiales bacterium]